MVIFISVLHLALGMGLYFGFLVGGSPAVSGGSGEVISSVVQALPTDSLR